MAENGNGNGRGILGPQSLLSVATAVGLLGAAIGGTWWVAVKTSAYDRDISALQSAIAQQSAQIKDVRTDCFDRVRLEHETDYFSTETRWQRLHDLNRDLVIPALEYRPLPGDPR